jgi:collagenase-like PrtC family protease
MARQAGANFPRKQLNALLYQTSMTGKIELLAPAKNASTAITAILAGADAVYIGAERFGARQAAANTIEDIRNVTEFAHQYYAKVYVTLNVLLYDDELPIVRKIINQLYKTGIDGLIIQDTGLLELDLPPIPLIASTQMDNSTLERVKFLQDVGFKRVILARELSLKEIRHIRSGTSIELECFIHGALCVGASGLCLLSYAVGGRSGNRGQCAQPCRRLYSLKDKNSKTIVKDRYLLSLKDLNLSEYLEELVDAGVTAFKIEGRLKDIPYVANTTAYYRQLLDKILKKKKLQKSSCGSITLKFEPNPGKTFNRGFTDYGITEKLSKLGSIDTPKSIGEYIGTVKKADKSFFLIDSKAKLHNGDGICFFDREQNLLGTTVNRVEGQKIYPQKTKDILTGRKIYRNYDHQFAHILNTNPAERKIGISLIIKETENGLILAGTDEDKNNAEVEIKIDKKPALKKETAQEAFHNQLTRLGNTIFQCIDLKIETQDIYFVPACRLNDARRRLIEQLLKIREINRPRPTSKIPKNNVIFPQKYLSFSGNVLNKKAEAFYRRHGVETIEPAAEFYPPSAGGLALMGQAVMKTKYCLRKELNLCRRNNSENPAEPLIVQDQDGREFEACFLCGKCGMEIYLGYSGD